MPKGPPIVDENVILENRRNSLFQAHWNKFIVLIVMIVIGFAWLLFRTDLSREPELPNRPLTRADVPLLKKKVKFLKADANMASAVFPHLNNKAELQAVKNAVKEVGFSPQFYPAVVQLKNIEQARFAQSRPDLVEGMRVAREYEDARFNIANNPAVTDKLAAVEALDQRFAAAKKSSQYAHYTKEYHTARTELIGDPEFDRANQACQKRLHELILKHHPELAEFLREEESWDAAYNHFMAQANDLSRKIAALESGTKSVPPGTAPAETSSPGNISGNREPRSGELSAASIPPGRPEYAVAHHVNVGDTVTISAVKPVIAFRYATITAMDDEHLTVRVGGDSFIVRWKDLLQLKPSNKK